MRTHARTFPGPGPQRLLRGESCARRRRRGYGDAGELPSRISHGAGRGSPAGCWCPAPAGNASFSQSSSLLPQTGRPRLVSARSVDLGAAADPTGPNACRSCLTHVAQQLLPARGTGNGAGCPGNGGASADALVLGEPTYSPPTGCGGTAGNPPWLSTFRAGQFGLA